MTDTKDFLETFTEQLADDMGTPVGLYHALDTKAFHQEYRYEEEKKRLEELKDVLDKILSILYHPHIKVETEDVVKRSELAGKLSHESFSDTMRDPQLWKEKNGQMVPEYVHAVETLDSIETYENRFIALLIDALEEDIDTTLDTLSPLMESIEEHYQSKGLTFGAHSPMRDMRSRVYPYASFLLSGNGNKEEILALARKIKRRCRNLRSTEFYQVNHKHPIGKNVLPTNILIHDRLYSYCYRYYVSHYKKEEKEELRRQILYFNYFFVSLLFALKRRGLLKEDGLSSLSLDEKGMIQFPSLVLSHYPFTFTLEADPENIALKLMIEAAFDAERDQAEYCFLTRSLYHESTKEEIERQKRRAEEKGAFFFLVTENNILKDYDRVLTLSYHRLHNEQILDDLLSSLTILFAADKELYTGFCPVCGHTHIHFNGKEYLCQDCHSTYTMAKIDGENLLWIRSFRKE